MDNWANLLQGSAILLIVAMAMTLIVSAGAIDLSVGVALDFGAAFALVALKTASAVAGRGGLRPARRRADWPAQCLSDPHLPDPPLPRHARHRFIASSAERIYTDGGGAIAYRRMAPEYHDRRWATLAGSPRR